MKDVRLAVVGKGGVGKSTIVGTIARLMARKGRRVLALDLDPNPGLAWSLGMALRDDGLPPGIAEPIPDAPSNAWRLIDGIDASEELERFVALAPDGVRYLSPGKITGPAFLERSSVFAVREIIRGIHLPGWDIVADIDAATAVSCHQQLAFARQLLLLRTPQPAAALTVRRLQALLHGTASAVIVTMDRGGPSSGAADALASIPFDRCVREADRRGLALVDYAPTSPVVLALDELTDRLLNEDPLAHRCDPLRPFMPATSR